MITVSLGSAQFDVCCSKGYASGRAVSLTGNTGVGDWQCAPVGTAPIKPAPPE